MSGHRLVIKDAARQLIGRIISALFGFLTIKIMTPYLGPLGYGDYSTILKYFAIWTALADLGLYVLAVKRLGAIKEAGNDPNNEKLKSEYGKFVGTRITIMAVIYFIAILIAYFLPAYTSNQYLIRGLPFGLIFSASFMLAGIQQLPLQIFWKMEQLSITLITARLSQLAILIPVVYIFFKDMKFDGSTISIVAFCAILFSVVASGIGQNIEIHYRSKKILPLKVIFDRKFTKSIVTKNRQYGISYYLSSFHTLIVLLFLGRFFPTSGGNDYAGIRALSLSLIEILLIIPSSLGNSLLHRISNYSMETKRKSMGSLMTLVYRIGGIVALNFWIFADQIILIVSGKAFIGTFGLIQYRGSNQILPFLGVVLRRSFIKQIYNYLFVSVERQNVLLGINLFGVIIGVLVGLYTIPKYGLFGGIITQVLLEFLFMIGAIAVAKTKKINLITPRKTFWRLSIIIIVFGIIGFTLTQYIKMTILNFFIIAILLNLALVYISLPSIKKVARGLTFE
ncbi:MAG: oligosaccharide flippase family protein [Candidatus Absconditicoccaceae bacterium]